VTAPRTHEAASGRTEKVKAALPDPRAVFCGVRTAGHGTSGAGLLLHPVTRAATGTTKPLGQVDLIIIVMVQGSLFVAG
jgi:hypothetical protein